MATRECTRRIAIAATPDGPPARYGPYPHKRDVELFRAEFYRFRETIRVAPDRRSDPISYIGRLYGIIENLTAVLERTTNPITGVEQWWVIFMPHPTVVDYWRSDPLHLEAAKRRHEFFLVMQGGYTDDPSVIRHRDDLEQRSYDKFMGTDPLDIVNREAAERRRSQPLFTAAIPPPVPIDTDVAAQQDALRAEYERQRSAASRQQSAQHTVDKSPINDHIRPPDTHTETQETNDGRHSTDGEHQS